MCGFVISFVIVTYNLYFVMVRLWWGGMCLVFDGIRSGGGNSNKVWPILFLMWLFVADLLLCATWLHIVKN